MSRVYLRVPKKHEMHHRKEWFEDKATMEYNSGYASSMIGYDYQTGIISQPLKSHQEWLVDWINQEPRKFYAFIMEKETDFPIGEAYFYFSQQDGIHHMGILLDAKYRNQGLGKEAILELEKIAFENNHIRALTDVIPFNRESAIYAFKNAGFHQNKVIHGLRFNKDEENAELVITKEYYEKKIAKNKAKTEEDNDNVLEFKNLNF